MICESHPLHTIPVAYSRERRRFISDYMGRSPLISDTEHTTRLPMDVDEDVFTPACTTIPLPRSPLSLLEPNSSDFKYFGLKCRYVPDFGIVYPILISRPRLAQLVKDIKRRSLRDSVQNDPAAHEQFTLEQAAACANEVRQWLADLPSTFRMDIDSDTVQPLRPDGGTSAESTTVSPMLLAQRCELAVTAQRLVMKIYIPFLRPSYSHGNSTSYYQATVGTFTAAHAIIRSLRALCSMWKHRPDLRGRRPIPALFSFYSFSRALFDAAVACAHNVIKDPNSVWVHTAFEDVNYALEVLRDPMLNTGRGPMRGGVEGSVHEAIKIVELLQRKAESARSGGSDTVSTGMKRKHDEIEADVEQLRHGFRFPFVSAPVMSANDPAPTIDSSAPPRPNQTARRVSPAEEQAKHSPSARSKLGSESHKCKDKHAKKPPYPQTGIRVRPGKEPSPFGKLCISPAPAPLSAGSDAPPSLCQVTSIAASPVVEQAPYVQQSIPSAPASQGISTHHSALPQKLDGGSVDFLLPFGAGDEAAQVHASMTLDIPQSRRYPEIGQEVSGSQPVGNTAPPGFERPHSVPFSGSSPASYAASSGSYSNISSPYTNGGTQFSTTPSLEQPSSSFEMSTPTQSFYPYDAPRPAHSLALVGVNHSGDDMPFRMQDQAVSQNGDLFQYPQDKSHQGMYVSERHASVPQSPFTEQSMQAWTPQASAVSEEGGFWRSYDPFPA